MSLVFEGYQKRSARFQQEFESPLSDVLGATAEQAFSELPVPSMVRAAELTSAQHSPERIDAPTARQRVKDAGLEGRLTIGDTGIAQPALDILIDRKREEVKRQEVLTRAPGGFGPGAARLGTALATSLLDPLNVGLAFVPVVSQARYLRYLGAARGVIGRSAVRVGVGAAEGAAGAALIEPLVLLAKTQEQADYDFQDSLLNVAFGTVFGGGLHTLAGAGADAVRAFRGQRLEAPSMKPGTAAARIDVEGLPVREAALRTAVGQAMEGKAVDVEVILPRIPDEERLIQRQVQELLAAREADLVSATQSRDALAVAISGDTAHVQGDLQRAVDERDLLAAEIAQLPDASPRRAELIERQGRAQQLVESRRTSVDRMNRVRAAENDLEQLRFARESAKSIDDLVDVLPTAQQRGFRQRIERGRAGGDVRPAGADLATLELEAPAPRQQAPEPTAIMERQASPEADITADVRASATADEQLAEQPPGVDPVAELEAQLAIDLAELKDVARIADLQIDNELDDLDELIASAESYGKAARAAALCGMGH